VEEAKKAAEAKTQQEKIKLAAKQAVIAQKTEQRKQATQQKIEAS